MNQSMQIQPTATALSSATTRMGDGRTRRAATQQIDESLRRLQTDRLDLLQFHEVSRLEDADRIFSVGGAFTEHL